MVNNFELLTSTPTMFLPNTRPAGVAQIALTLRAKRKTPSAKRFPNSCCMGRLLRQRRLADSYALPNTPRIARRKEAEKFCPQSTEQTAASHPSAHLLQWPPCGSRSTVCHRRDLTDGDSEAQSPSKFPLIFFLFE